ncbi:hypothetical protein HMPREF6123_1015, partial [Oribacterium sinus F0268]
EFPFRHTDKKVWDIPWRLLPLVLYLHTHFSSFLLLHTSYFINFEK